MDVGPRVDGVHPVRQFRDQRGDFGAERGQSRLLHRVSAAIEDHVAQLPLGGPGQHHDQTTMADSEPGEVHTLFVVPAGQDDPHDVHGGGVWPGFESRQGAHTRRAPVRRHGQLRAQFVLTVVIVVADALDESGPILLDDEIRHPRPHPHVEAGVGLRLVHDELEELRLGNHGDKREAGSQTAEVTQDGRRVAAAQRHALQPAVRSVQQSGCQSKVVEHLERRRVDSIAAEGAVKVLLGFEQHGVNAQAREEQGEDGAARSASDDAATGAVSHQAVDTAAQARWPLCPRGQAVAGRVAANRKRT